MGFFDVITGRRKLAGPAPDRLFAMSTAYVTLETGLGITSRGGAAIVFQPLATADFETIVRDMEEVVQATAADSGTTVTNTDDAYGYRWLVLRGKDFEDLVVGINAVSGALETGGYGDRVLCAVFAAAARDLGVDARQLVMVGDDIHADVLGAQRAGMAGVLVRTGKFRPSDLAGIEEEPDHVLDDIGQLPDLLRSRDS